MLEFIRTKSGQSFLNDVRRIADAMESIAKSLKPVGEYMETNKDLIDQTSQVQREVLKQIEKEQEMLYSREEAAVRGDDYIEPGC